MTSCMYQPTHFVIIIAPTELKLSSNRKFQSELLEGIVYGPQYPEHRNFFTSSIGRNMSFLPYQALSSSPALDGLKESLVHTDHKMEANGMYNHTQLTALPVMTSI